MFLRKIKKEQELKIKSETFIKTFKENNYGIYKRRIKVA